MTVPSILGFDHEISLDYLKKGDEFVAFDPKTRFFRHGVADMDGHMVSADYGFRDGNHFYEDNPQRNYINVCWSDMKYEWPSARKFGEVLDGVYVGPNNTIYQRDDLIILVKKSVWDRAQRDIYDNKMTDSKKASIKKAEDELRVAQQAFSAASLTLKSAEKQLEYTKKIAEL